MKKLLVAVIVLLVAVLMTQMVPDKAAHKAAMMEAIRAYVDEEVDSKGLGDNVLTKLGKNLVSKTIEVSLNSKLEVNNYYLFNTTHMKQGGKDRTLSLGMFGHVFTFDKKMLRESLEQAAEEKEETKSEHKAAKEAAKEAKKLERQLKKEQRKQEKAQRKLEKEKRKREKKAKKANAD